MFADKQMVYVVIRLKYIGLKKVIDLTPKERLAAIDSFFRENFSKLLNAGVISDYEVMGTKKRPTGVKTNIAVKDIERISRFRFVESITTVTKKPVKQITAPAVWGYYCVKMTVVIQIEGFTNGMQSYEERYVLVKARSFNEAYYKAERRAGKYAEPYLNSDGRLVRWKVERYDDCFITDIADVSELDKPEGVEVFSVLKSRRLTKERAWDGKTK